MGFFLDTEPIRAYPYCTLEQRTAQLAGSVLLLAALILAPAIGGGYGELASGVIEVLVLAGIIARLAVPGPERGVWARAPGLLPLAVFFLAVCVSTAFSESIYASLNQLLYVAACLGAYALAVTAGRDPKTAAAFVWGVVLPALVICLIGTRDYAIGAGGGASFWKTILGPGLPPRLFGTFINPGFFAGYLVVVLPITMGAYLVTRKTVLAMLAGIAVVLQTVALMLTGTKFGIVAAVVALLVLFLLAIATRSLKRARFKRLIIIAAVLTPLLLVFSASVIVRISEAESGGSQVHSTTFRVYTWDATVEMIKSRPWLGVGPGVFEYAYPRYTIAGPTKNAHQGYLQIAAESGLVALAAFVLALVSVAYWSLDGTVRNSKEPSAHHATDDTPTTGITLRDLVPFSGWRMINCAIFAALAGSAVRNLADSDWFLMGIALPFGVMMGVLIAQSGAAKREFVMGGAARIAGIVVCAAMVLFAGSFGLGDLVAPDDTGASVSNSEALSGYRLASRLSPLNPKYHRELGKYLFAEGEADAALRELDAAARLAPKDPANYATRALVASAAGRPQEAVSYYSRALQYNPKSTQLLYQLAVAKHETGDIRGFEGALTRLIGIEDSEYERIKGVPEMVDTTFAFAHAWFGEKYLARKRYARAITEFTSAIDRLEKWRSNEDMLQVMRFSGRLTKEEERETLELLRSCYHGLADAYSAMGQHAAAGRARARAERIEID